MTTQKASTGKAGYPFWDFDMTKIVAPFDPAKFNHAKAAGEFVKMAGRYQVPGLDVDTLVEAQARNLEALNAANQESPPKACARSPSARPKSSSRAWTPPRALSINWARPARLRRRQPSRQRSPRMPSPRPSKTRRN